MLSNQLNKVITIQQGTTGVNSVGSPSLSWSDYITTYAKVTVTSGDTKNDTNGELFTYKTDFTIRYNLDTKKINNKYRVKYNCSYYKIMQVQELGIKDGFKLTTVLSDDGDYPEI
jgi:SPP1 family predicted phage head-tail adaptor